MKFKTKFNFFCFFLLTFLVSSSLTYSQESVQHKYVGAKTCMKCHKSKKQGNQYRIWKESLHAQAYEILKTEKADKICLEKGFGNKAIEAKECLTCHASGWDVEPEFIGKKFQIEDGVQCETCHGPGNDYKSLKIMKNKELAVKNGLIDISENVETFCRNCHNPDSPTFTGFNFGEMWKKIEHPLPFRKK